MCLSEQRFTGAVERQQQQELQGIDQVIHQLDDGLVEAQPQAHDRAQERTGAENRENSDDPTEGDGQGDAGRRDALFELAENRGDDAPLPAMATLVDAMESMDSALLDELAREVAARRRRRRGS